jgi:hypothetical protein
MINEDPFLKPSFPSDGCMEKCSSDILSRAPILIINALGSGSQINLVVSDFRERERRGIKK